MDSNIAWKSCPVSCLKFRLTCSDTELIELTTWSIIELDWDESLDIVLEIAELEFGIWDWVELRIATELELELVVILVAIDCEVEFLK